MSTPAATRAPADAALPPPAAGRGLPLGLTPGRIAAAIGLLVLAAVPIPFGDFGYFVGQYVLVYTLIGLSVVIVTGYAGLISLMPYSFAGIGAMVAGVAMASWGWPFWLAAPLAALATVPISVLVGMASVRLKGLYLAIATLTFADALGETFFNWQAATNGDVGWLVERPTIGPISFDGDLPFYLLCLVTVGLAVWMVDGIRVSRLGRAMVATRDNEAEAQALGINVYKTKMVALVVGGLVAGLGGAYLAALVRTATASPFRSPLVQAVSILFVTLVAIGGMDRAVGALFGAAVVVVQQQVFGGAEFFFAFIGMYSAVLLILLLRFQPRGLVELGRQQWELIRRRPALGITLAVLALGVNVGLAWIFVSVS